MIEPSKSSGADQHADDKSRRPAKHPAELLAEAGDLDGLVRYLSQSDRSDSVLQASVNDLLYQAAQVANQGDPSEVAGYLLQTASTAATFWLARIEIWCHKRLTTNPSQHSDELVDQLLPLRASVQEQLAQLLLARAKVARLWKLARSRRRKRRRSSVPPNLGRGNGSSPTRRGYPLEGLLDIDLGPGDGGDGSAN